MKNINQAHWRDSARSVKFWIWDGKAAFPMLLFIMHISWWTLCLAVGATTFFSILMRYGFTPAIFGRWLRSLFAGSRKISKPWWVE
ncbi:MAG: IcmT/TraK family protein [Gammaproteobacteria bacterium]|nr:IcmT/TraK family protein [Gammaproteobacteria bacterium]